MGRRPSRNCPEVRGPTDDAAPRCIGAVCTRMWANTLLAIGIAVTASCGTDEGVGVGQQHFAVAEPGPWHIPPTTLAVGDQQYVSYTGAGPWVGEEGCGGSLLAGTDVLREYLYLYFPQAYSIGGYSCRPIVGNSSAMSVHATGRALDIMIHTVDGEADNSKGDEIGNWLIENAEFIGVQMIIWDRWLWRADRDPPKDKDYTGEHPHHDHLHVELSVDAANLMADFFNSPMQPPDLISCGTLGADGGIVDDADLCAGFYGPPEYWRSADGVGYGGSMLWTNAFSNDRPSNWGRWVLDLEQAGTYRVEVYLSPPYAVFDRTRYEVVHNGQAEVLEVDQSQAQAEGWYSLGTFEFAAGRGQHVSVFDNGAGDVPDEQHVAFDAVRLTRCAGDACDDAPQPDEDEPGASLDGGCQTGSGGGPIAAWLMVAALLAARRRLVD